MVLRLYWGAAPSNTSRVMSISWFVNLVLLTLTLPGALATRLPCPPERTVVRVVNALIKLASEQLRICTVDVQSHVVSAYVYVQLR